MDEADVAVAVVDIDAYRDSDFHAAIATLCVTIVAAPAIKVPVVPPTLPAGRPETASDAHFLH